MKAGRELDALIAEKVMGLQISKEWVDDEHEEFDYLLLDDEDNYRWTNPVPFYSTDIAAAWEVRSKFTDWKSCHRFTHALYGIVRYRMANDLSELYLIIHITPEDICLAALKALGKI